MTAQETTTGKVIGNVGLLDLRTATPESVATVKQIGNVGTVYYTPQTAHLLTQISIRNLGNTLELPNDAKIISGQTTLDRAFFADQTEASAVLITGLIVIEADVTAADLQQGANKLLLHGHILCPAPLVGILQRSVKDQSGKIQPYSPQAKLIVGDFTLDEIILNTLNDGSALAITGRLNMPVVLANDLLAQKLTDVTVGGSITCREENVSTLLSHLDSKGGQPKITRIPADFTLVNQHLMLDAGILNALPDRKLYCQRGLQIDTNITADQLDHAIDAFEVQQGLLAPLALQATVAKKCNLLETEATFYQGDLWLIEGEGTLQASRFDYVVDKATLVVRGELTIDPDITPQTLVDKLDKVHLFGEIIATAAQIAALQMRAGTIHGEFIDSAQGAAATEGGIGNIGTLKL